MIRPGKVATSPEVTPKERVIWDDVDQSTLRSAAKNQDSSKMRPETRKPRTGQAQVETAKAVNAGEITGLEKTLKYEFRDRKLFARALTHRSALSMEERSDYERLEFLGDAVLGLGIAHLLIDKYPEAKEGELSKMRAALVNAQSLASIARRLNIGPFIRVGRSEASAGGQDRPSILADVFEAVLGAIYLDRGFTDAFRVVQEVFANSLGEVQTSDPKSELQELLHATGSEPPQYLLELVEGPDHAPTFVTVVVIDSEIAGRGRGSTKKAAQQAAAAEALAKLLPNEPPVKLARNQREIIPELLLAPVQQSNEENHQEAEEI